MVACLAWGRKPCLGSTPAGRAVGLARQGASWAAWAGAVFRWGACWTAGACPLSRQAASWDGGAGIIFGQGASWTNGPLGQKSMGRQRAACPWTLAGVRELDLPFFRQFRGFPPLCSCLPFVPVAEPPAGKGLSERARA